MNIINQQNIAATIIVSKAVILIISTPLFLLFGVWGIYAIAANPVPVLFMLVLALGLVGLFALQYVRIAGGNLSETTSRIIWLLSIIIHLPLAFVIIRGICNLNPQALNDPDYNFYMFLVIGLFFCFVTLLSALALFISFRPKATS
jgi:hypothetical protein